MKKLLVFALAGACLLSSALAEIANVAKRGAPSTDGALWGGGNMYQMIDGNRAAQIHLDVAPFPGTAYYLDLGKNYNVTELRIYPRQDTCCAERLQNIRVSVHSDAAGTLGAELWGTNMFTDGSNAGNGPGRVVNIPLPAPQNGRWVQVKTLGDIVTDYALQMTELEVYADVPASEVNRALNTAASSNRLLYNNAQPGVLVDGSRSAVVHGTNTQEAGFSYSINLGATIKLSEIVIWARQDPNNPERLSNYRVSVHTDNAGQIGNPVWTADLHTDGSNIGADYGLREVLTADLNASGQFQGQWINIQSLDNPVPDYALQIAEVEAYGSIEGSSSILISRHPANAISTVGRTATFSVVANVPGGDLAKLAYQWQKEGANIEGATNASYTTPPLLLADDGKKIRCVVSYPDLASKNSDEATIRLNLAFQAAVTSNRPLWANGGWNISQMVDGDRGLALHGDVDIVPGMAYEFDLGSPVTMDEIVIYPRQDGCCPERLKNIHVSVHDDNDGAIGAEVWGVDLFTDGSNAGSGAGAIINLKAGLHPAGKFEGQWIRMLALDDPLDNYAMQMSELEVYGKFVNGSPVLQLVRSPEDYGSAPGRPARFSTEAKVVNGDPTRITYQWQKNGVNIPDAKGTNYVTPPLLEADAGTKYRVVVSYPGTADVISEEAAVSFDYNYAKGQPAQSSGPLWGPGNWDISVIADGIRNNIAHAGENPPSGFSYSIDLGLEVAIEAIDIYPRQDTCCPERLANFRLSVHADNAGEIGAEVWGADLFTDGSNPGAGAGLVARVLADSDPAHPFQGQWVKILALDDPVPNYHLQLAEIEVIGRPVGGGGGDRPSLVVARGANSVTLSWPAGISGYVLESADALPAGAWTAVPGVANNSITITAPAGIKFYRLKSQ